MKKAYRAAAFLAAFVLLFGAVSLTARAKDLEYCRLCGGSGDFHCSVCGNTGEVVCDLCGGAGFSECPGEDGKGKCDHGHYVCPSCHGDGRSRTGDGAVTGGPCGQCGGDGQIECWRCHGTGGDRCNRCGGAGKTECREGTCVVSRAYGWKCPDCKGTGYILVGRPMPPKSSNDGVRNQPVAGDHIIIDEAAHYIVYGSGSSSAGSSGSSAGSSGGGAQGAAGQTEPAPPDETEPGGGSPAAEPAEPPVGTAPADLPPEAGPDGEPADEPRWTVDFGDGMWHIADPPVVTWIDGRTVDGNVEVEAYTPIWLEDFDRDTMRALLCGEDGFSVELIPNGDNEVSVGRCEPADAAVPERVRFVVEMKEDASEPAPAGHDAEDVPGEAPDSEPLPPADGAPSPNALVIAGAVLGVAAIAVGTLALLKKKRH